MTTHRSKVKLVINALYWTAFGIAIVLLVLSFIFPILWWITPEVILGLIIYTIASFFRLKVPQRDGAVLLFGEAIVEGGTDVTPGFGWRPWPLDIKLYPLSKQMEWKPRVTFHKGDKSDTDPLDRQLTAEPVITGWLVVVDKEKFLEMGELSWETVEERVFEALKAAVTNEVNKTRAPHKLTLGGFIDDAEAVLAEVLKGIQPTLENYGVDLKKVGGKQTLELKEDGVPEPIRKEMEKSATKLQEEQGRRDAANLARETTEKEAEAKAKAVGIMAHAQAGAIEKIGAAKAGAVKALAAAIPGSNATNKAKIIATASGNTAGAVAFFGGSTLSINTPDFVEGYVDLGNAKEQKPKENDKKPEEKKEDKKK